MAAKVERTRVSQRNDQARVITQWYLSREDLSIETLQRQTTRDREVRHRSRERTWFDCKLESQNQS